MIRAFRSRVPTRPERHAATGVLWSAGALWLALTAGCPQNSGTPDAPIALNPDGTVVTIAGTGEIGYSGDGGASVRAKLSRAADVAVDRDGRVLFADVQNHRIRCVDLSTGIIVTLAGDGSTSGTEALDSPTGITPLPSGEFLVASWGSNQVFRYAADHATRSIVIGNGLDGCNDDFSQNAASVPLFAPRSVDVLADGSILVGEQGCSRISRVRGDGSILAYAGLGTSGYSGDGQAAVNATLHAGELAAGPSFGLSLSPEDPPDELFIADSLNHVVRVVKPFTGLIETFAGTGQAGFADGPPLAAQFNTPAHVFCARDHSLWIADTGNHVIRYIDPLRTRVLTIAGTGTAGFNGDGLPATETQLNEPLAVFVTEDRYVYVADAGNARIRRFKYLGN